MKRWLVAAAAAWALGAAVAPVAAQDAGLTVYCNGTPVKLAAVLRNGVAYYPVQPVVNAFATDLHWNPTVRALRVGNSIVDVEPVFIGEEIYLPLETVAEALGASATWNPARGEVVLNRKPQINAANNSAPMVSFVEGNHLPEDYTTGGRTATGLQPPPSTPVRPAPGAPDPLAARRVAASLSREGAGDIYTPKMARNAAFQVTVTNLEVVNELHGKYQAREGYRYVIVYLSQKNVTMQPVLNPGNFYLQDQDGNDFEPVTEHSNFMGVVLKPYGVNFGYFVYEMPQSAVPIRLVLVTTTQSPVTVNL